MSRNTIVRRQEGVFALTACKTQEMSDRNATLDGQNGRMRLG